MRWLTGARLDRYVGRIMLGGSMLALAILLGLDALFEFLAQMDELEADYRARQAAIYIALRVPERVPLLLPFAVLFGALASFGMLDGRGELQALRTAGLCRWRIIWMSLKPLLLISALALALIEYPLPESHRFAQDYRDSRLGERPARSLWHSRVAGEYLHLGDVSDDGRRLRQVSLFRAAGAQLPLALRAAAADYDHRRDLWRLEDASGAAAALGCRGDNGVTLCDLGVDPEFLRLTLTPPQRLSLSGLWDYAEALEAIGRDAARHRQRFWFEALSPLNTAALIALALAFAFGPLRSVGGGLRIGMGVALGLIFHFARDMIGMIGLLFGMAAPIAALLPSVLCLAVAVGVLRRA